MVNTAELRQIFPLRENTLRHVVEGDGRYPRAMTPSEYANQLLLSFPYMPLRVYHQRKTVAISKNSMLPVTTRVIQSI